MPTIITHAVIPIAIAAATGRRRIPTLVAMSGALLAILPDFDVMSFRLGIPYGNEWGHRGATHSLVFAFAITGVAIFLSKRVQQPAIAAFLMVSASSHGLLDMMTDGGRGVALLWPYDSTRYFAPWQPIRVSPIGSRFFAARGLETVWSELLWVWLPSLSAAIALIMVRRRAISHQPPAHDAGSLPR